MTEMWAGIQAGDVGFDQGGGVVGFLIRHFSHSPYAHCWVYHSLMDDGRWRTAEAYPGGLRERVRSNSNVHRVIRAWRTEEERQALLAKSDELVGAGYNYRELFRIVHYRIRQSFVWFAVVAFALSAYTYFFGSRVSLAFAFVFSFLLLYAAFPLRTKLNERRVICSNHVAQSVLAARPDVKLTYPPQSVWPGRLERDLNVMIWNDWVRDDQG